MLWAENIDWIYVLEIIALLSGALGVVLTAHERVSAWGVWFICELASIILYFDREAMANVGLHIIYLVLNIYGWVIWRRNLEQDSKLKKIIGSKSALPIRHISLKTAIICSIIMVSGSILVYYLLVYYSPNTEFPITEAILSVASAICTYLMARKIIENWLIWVAVDFWYFWYNFELDLDILAYLSLFYVGYSLYTYRRWKLKIINPV
jgi:nicotinamide mononucleotide transporter